ncbi:MAG: ABC transporter substrate-binding protein [Myxococcales bacterium]|nr:ABC transporter substrate-binding protein [Myxococcales bacterium]
MSRVRTRALIVSVALAGPWLGACRSTHASGTHAVGVGTQDPGRVAPEFEADWEAVKRAQTQDPGAPAVAAAADRLLARDPPRNLRLAALHAKAEQALLAGDYPGALRFASGGVDVGAARGEPLSPPEQGLVQQLGRVRALAGAVAADDPKQALAWLKDAEIGTDPDPDLLAAVAIARERAGDRAGAVLAYAQWRAALGDDDPAAALAETRMQALWVGVDDLALEATARQTTGLAAACLLTRAGHAPDPAAPAWVRGCVPGAAKIGLLLPRTGKFAGLADIQLAAASAAVAVLARGGREAASLVWQDAGSTPAEAGKATAALVRGGADVLVGPVGPGNVDAAVKSAAAAGGKSRFVLPGEGTSAAPGIAPTLEARAGALVAHAKQLGRASAVILAPNNSYGKRAGDSIEKSLEGSGIKLLRSLYYPDSETSFARTLAPVLDLLVKGEVAVFIPDRMVRMELVVRQLARAGVGKNAAILTTGEGFSEALGPGHEVLNGVWVAPVAWPTPDAAAFADEYQAREGQQPGDQAWLIWRAMAAAWGGGRIAPPAAAVLRVEGGRLVLAQPTADLQPRETR